MNPVVEKQSVDYVSVLTVEVIPRFGLRIERSEVRILSGTPFQFPPIKLRNLRPYRQSPRQSYGLPDFEFLTRFQGPDILKPHRQGGRR